jgi:hypothetical protein
MANIKQLPTILLSYELEARAGHNDKHTSRNQANQPSQKLYSMESIRGFSD